ncbi:phosphotransferase enzyme family protein [Gorillibacterium sp. sgz5001074]|uniref:phosphotransferase enzyme family protein n=1 Tax=Gorillibacterium sp. sgz5001074 TaxID=3446695 RepID=UPI003F675996
MAGEMDGMKRIGAGRTADIYLTGGDRIVKLYKSEMPEVAIREEFAFSRAVFEAGIPTPEPYEQVMLEGRHGIVFRRVTGGTLLKRMTRFPLLVGKHSRKLAALHHELHGLEADMIVRNQKPALKEAILGAPFLNEEEKRRILEELERLPVGNRVCHGDFHPDNVMVEPDGRVLVIDWMTAMAGHPAGDAARSVVLFSYGTMPEGTPRLVTALVNGIRRKLTKEYIKHYLRVSGMEWAEVDRWILPVAAARLREWLPPEEKELLLRTIRERLDGLSDGVKPQ